MPRVLVWLLLTSILFPNLAYAGSFLDSEAASVGFNPNRFSAELRGLSHQAGLVNSAINLINSLLTLAAITAIAFVIIGGIRYLTSQGDEEAVRQAKQTIINAILGVIFILLSVAIVNFIASQVQTDNNTSQSPESNIQSAAVPAGPLSALEEGTEQVDQSDQLPQAQAIDAAQSGGPAVTGNFPPAGGSIGGLPTPEEQENWLPWAGKPWPQQEEELREEFSAADSPSSNPDSLLMRDANFITQCFRSSYDEDAYNEAGVPAQEAEEIAQDCINEYPFNIFQQVECAANKLGEYFDTTSANEVCRNYAASFARIAPLLDACGVSVEAEFYAFTVAVIPTRSGHAVNRIKICPTKGPNQGQCFTYMYEPWWDGFKKIFFPADDFTINYHQNQSNRHALPQICDDETLAEISPPPLPPLFSPSPSPGTP